jgi:hypothetical protein
MKIEHDDDCACLRGFECDCGAGETSSNFHNEPIEQKPVQPTATSREHDDDCAYHRGLGCDCGVDKQ